MERRCLGRSILAKPDRSRLMSAPSNAFVRHHNLTPTHEHALGRADDLIARVYISKLLVLRDMNAHFLPLLTHPFPFSPSPRTGNDVSLLDHLRDTFTIIPVCL